VNNGLRLRRVVGEIMVRCRPTEATVDERRKEPRTRAYLGGRVAFSNGFATTDCVVRNRSDHGALLVLSGHAHVPDRFELRLPSRDVAVAACARWRRAGAIGVEFLDAAAD
jgi:hypothetical protein